MGALRAFQWELAVLGTCLLVILSACASQTRPAQIKQPAPLAPQLLQARTNAQTLLEQFTLSIRQAQTHGFDVGSYRLQLDEDSQTFQNAQTTQAYNDLAKAIQTQMLALQRGLTSYDLQQLETLIGQTDITNDYEYRDAEDAYLEQQDRFQEARAINDYQKIDTQTQILLTNLRALLANLKDSTPHDQPHAADLQLIQTYHLMGKIIIVSLTEQTLRMYKNTRLVGWMYVVTGQRDAQTPPGLWNVRWKQAHLVFRSSAPPGSPLWYPPTPINYGLEYHKGGYFLHDATWRWYFGPGANLPHHDYTAPPYSTNGTHGCINMTLANTRTLFDWAEVGIPVIVY